MHDSYLAALKEALAHAPAQAHDTLQALIDAHTNAQVGPPPPPPPAP